MVGKFVEFLHSPSPHPQHGTVLVWRRRHLSSKFHFLSEGSISDLIHKLLTSPVAASRIGLYFVLLGSQAGEAAGTVGIDTGGLQTHKQMRSLSMGRDIQWNK